jgi:DNA-binding transcriptional LysR family regulator
MTVQQLRYFLAVAQYLHFGEAAKACFISQPSLSHSISELETELNLKLFYRDNRVIDLTPAGKVFCADIQSIITRLDDAVIRAKRAGSGYDGVLNIGSLGGLSAGKFPASIMAFKKKYPNLDVTLKQSNMKTLNMGLLQGTLDVALTRRIDVLQRSDELAWATLYQDRFGIVLRKDHPLAERTHIPFSELADEPFVFLDKEVTPNVYNYTLQLCTSRGLVPRIMHTATTLEIVCTLLKAGMGIAIIPDCALAYGSNELTFIEVEGEDTVSDVVLAWRRRDVNPIVPIFLEEFDIGMF